DRKMLGPEQATWLGHLDRDHDNIRTALAWSRTSISDVLPSPAELGARLAGALLWFWYIRCHLTEGRRWAEPIIAADGHLPAGVRAKVMLALVGMIDAQGDHVEAAAMCDRAIPLFRE